VDGNKEIVGGFWILQARSKEEPIERLSHCPANFRSRRLSGFELRTPRV
jgi:hypothetical protein